MENYFIITFVPFLDEVGDGSIHSLFLAMKFPQPSGRWYSGEQVGFQTVDHDSIPGRRFDFYFLYFLHAPCQGKIVINACEGKSTMTNQ